MGTMKLKGRWAAAARAVLALVLAFGLMIPVDTSAARAYADDGSQAAHDVGLGFKESEHVTISSGVQKVYVQAGSSRTLGFAVSPESAEFGKGCGMLNYCPNSCGDDGEGCLDSYWGYCTCNSAQAERTTYVYAESSDPSVAQVTYDGTTATVQVASGAAQGATATITAYARLDAPSPEYTSDPEYAESYGRQSAPVTVTVEVGQGDDVASESTGPSTGGEGSPSGDDDGSASGDDGDASGDQGGAEVEDAVSQSSYSVDAYREAQYGTPPNGDSSDAGQHVRTTLTYDAAVTVTDADAAAASISYLINRNSEILSGYTVSASGNILIIDGTVNAAIFGGHLTVSSDALEGVTVGGEPAKIDAIDTLVNTGLSIELVQAVEGTSTMPAHSTYRVTGTANIRSMNHILWMTNRANISGDGTSYSILANSGGYSQTTTAHHHAWYRFTPDVSAVSIAGFAMGATDMSDASATDPNAPLALAGYKVTTYCAAYLGDPDPTDGTDDTGKVTSSHDGLFTITADDAVPGEVLSAAVYDDSFLQANGLSYGATVQGLATPDAVQPASQAMYRLYNPNSGEHFYTASAKERDNVVAAGWNYEGIGWTAPAASCSTTPVYRLYSGTDHHYTTSAEERDWLVEKGWRYEGVGWYSSDSKSVPLYRQFNPNVDPTAETNNSGSHNYTVSTSERDNLVGLGWRDEGIGWYGV